MFYDSAVSVRVYIYTYIIYTIIILYIYNRVWYIIVKTFYNDIDLNPVVVGGEVGENRGHKLL